MHQHTIQSPDHLDPTCWRLRTASRLLSADDPAVLRLQVRVDRLSKRVQGLESSRSFLEAELCGVLPS